MKVLIDEFCDQDVLAVTLDDDTVLIRIGISENAELEREQLEAAIDSCISEALQDVVAYVESRL